MKLNTPFSSPLVSPAELHHALTNPSRTARIIPIAAGRASSLQSYEARHVPGSVYVIQFSRLFVSNFLYQIGSSTWMWPGTLLLNIR